jgi:hypothetical protein
MAWNRRAPDPLLAKVRERVAAIQRETWSRGISTDPARDLATINTMCEAILDPDFAEEIGVEPTLPTAAKGD